MRKAVIIGIVGVGLLAGCTGDANPSVTPSVTMLQTSDGSSRAGFGITNGRYVVTNDIPLSTETMPVVTIGEATGTLLDGDVNSNSVADGFTSQVYAATINGTASTVSVITNKSTGDIFIESFALDDGRGFMTVSSPYGVQAIGNHTFNGTASATVMDKNTSYTNIPVQMQVDFSSGQSTLDVGNVSYQVHYSDQFTVDLQTGQFASVSGVGGTTGGNPPISNPQSVSTYGTLTGENAEGVVGVFAFNYDGVTPPGDVIGEEMIGAFSASR